MAKIELYIKYKKNGDLVISPSELSTIYLYGINIEDADGSDFSPTAIEFYIRSAQQEIEKFLNIRLLLDLITETQNYYKDTYYKKFPLLQPTYPVRQSLGLIGLLNKIEQIVYPPEWLSTYENSEPQFSKEIGVVPTGSSSVTGNFDVILTGITAYLGLQRYELIPNYWNLQYTTGYAANELPYDILNVIGKSAAIPILAIAGDLILGAGIARQSLSIDGLSQMIDSTSSATNSGYGARIINYNKEIEESLKRLQGIYKRINFTVI